MWLLHYLGKLRPTKTNAMTKEANTVIDLVTFASITWSFLMRKVPTKKRNKCNRNYSFVPSFKVSDTLGQNPSVFLSNANEVAHYIEDVPISLPPQALTKEEERQNCYVLIEQEDISFMNARKQCVE